MALNTTAGVCDGCQRLTFPGFGVKHNLVLERHHSIGELLNVFIRNHSRRELDGERKSSEHLKTASVALYMG